MTYVITDPCVGVCDAACTTVCPIDCIHGPVPLDRLKAVPQEQRAETFGAFQLYIDPELCIDCGACLPQCPVDAIYHQDDVPPGQEGAIAANAAFFA